MKRTGEATYDILTLCGIEESTSRMKLPHVLQRAISVKQFGLLQRPLVRASDSMIIAGFDRLAACMVAGLDEVTVDLYDCTDDELMAMRVAENVHRRHDRALANVVTVQAVKQVEAEVIREAAEEPAAPTSKPPRGKKTAKGVARDRVAATLNIKPESVRRAEYREKSNSEEKAPKPAIIMLGRKADVPWMAGVTLAKKQIEEARNKVKAALGAITRLEKSGTPYPNSALQRLREEVQSCGALLKDMTPYSLCPFCKRVAEVSVKCGACGGSGFVTEKVKGQVPEELWSVDKPVVAWNGKFIPLKEFSSDVEPASPDMDEPTDEELREPEFDFEPAGPGSFPGSDFGDLDT